MVCMLQLGHPFYGKMTHLFDNQPPSEEALLDAYYSTVMSETQQDHLQQLAMKNVAHCSTYDEFVMKRDDIYEFVMDDYLFHMPVSEEIEWFTS